MDCVGCDEGQMSGDFGDKYLAEMKVWWLKPIFCCHRLSGHLTHIPHF